MSEQLHQDQWICFQVESETYAQRVRQVQEIIDYTPPVPVPGANQSVEGVLNVRGEIVTIVSARTLLGVAQQQKDSGQIIIIDTEAGRVGVTVDSVDIITELNPESMSPIDTRQPGSPIWGTIHHHDQLLILADFNRSMTELESYE